MKKKKKKRRRLARRKHERAACAHILFGFAVPCDENWLRSIRLPAAHPDLHSSQYAVPLLLDWSQTQCPWRGGWQIRKATWHGRGTWRLPQAAAEDMAVTIYLLAHSKGTKAKAPAPRPHPHPHTHAHPTRLHPHPRATPRRSAPQTTPAQHRALPRRGPTRHEAGPHPGHGHTTHLGRTRVRAHPWWACISGSFSCGTAG